MESPLLNTLSLHTHTHCLYKLCADLLLVVMLHLPDNRRMFAEHALNSSPQMCPALEKQATKRAPNKPNKPD